MRLMEFTTDFGTKVMVNLDHVTSITEGMIDSDYTPIRLTNNSSILVKESYDYIKAILRQYIMRS